MTKKEIVEHWVKLLDNDLKVAEDLFVLKHYLYVGFMCHQSMEKIFKAYFAKNQKLTTMDQSKTIIDKVKTYRKLVAADFPLKIDQYWLFGSFANGNSHEDSDIDVALVVDKFDDNYNFFETEPILWKLSEKVDYRIEPHLIAKNTDFSGFLAEINKTGIRIN